MTRRSLKYVVAVVAWKVLTLACLLVWACCGLGSGLNFASRYGDRSCGFGDSGSPGDHCESQHELYSARANRR